MKYLIDQRFAIPSQGRRIQVATCTLSHLFYIELENVPGSDKELHIPGVIGLPAMTLEEADQVLVPEPQTVDVTAQEVDFEIRCYTKGECRSVVLVLHEGHQLVYQGDTTGLAQTQMLLAGILDPSTLKVKAACVQLQAALLAVAQSTSHDEIKEMTAVLSALCPGFDRDISLKMCQILLDTWNLVELCKVDTQD
jgi:hypothetical protein